SGSDRRSYAETRAHAAPGNRRRVLMHGGRRRAQLRGERPPAAGGAIQGNLDSTCGGRWRGGAGGSAVDGGSICKSASLGFQFRCNERQLSGAFVQRRRNSFVSGSTTGSVH